MYLKKISANGFKSFAEKIAIHLDMDQVTGIVGPNGAGKSNVIDAVRWVMGEQNAKMLRGEKATDIIFNGSEKRKPLGMAEVSLFFDNQHASSFCPPEYRHEVEIELTRRIYADGQREYLINRKPCRLKDLLSFFAASGLGGRSYSMIQQGQVDRILHAKPEQIREIVEEAAGIAVFRRRKLETHAKLADSTQNLSRLEDIMGEVEKQIHTLKKQAQEAQEYAALKADIRNQELKLLKHQQVYFSDKIAQLQQSVENARNLEIDLNLYVSETEKLYQQKKDQLEKEDPHLQALHESIVILRESLARLQANHQSCQKQIEDSKQTIQQFSQTWQDQDAQFRDVRERCAESQKTMEALTQQKESSQVAIETLEQEVAFSKEEILVHESRVESLKQQKQELQLHKQKLSMQMDQSKKEISKKTAEKSIIEDDLLKLDEKLSEASILSEAMSVKVNLKQRAIKDDLEKKHQLEVRRQNQQKQKELLEETLHQSKDDWTHLDARRQAIDEFEKTSKDLSSLLARSFATREDRALEDIFLLTDYIKVKDALKDFGETFMTLFERWSERLLVRDYAHLRDLYQLFKNRDFGYFPASLIDPKLEAAALTCVLELGCVAVIDFLQFEVDSLEIESFLRRLFIVPQDALFARIPENIASQLVLFSEQGFCIQGNGDFFFGRPSSDHLALSRNEEKLKLQQALQELETKKQQQQSQREALSLELKSIATDLSGLEHDIQTSNKESMDFLLESKNQEQKMLLDQERSKDIRRRYNELDEQCDQLSEALAQTQQDLQAVQDEQEKASEQLADLDDLMSDTMQRHEEQERQLQQKETELQSAQVRIQTMAEHSQRDLELYKELQETIEKRDVLKNEVESKYQDLCTEETKLAQEIKLCIEDKAAKDEQLLAHKEKSASLLETIRRIEEDVREKKSELSRIKKQSQDNQLDLERSKLVLETCMQNALEKYQVDLKTHMVAIEQDFNETKVKSHIESQKQKLGRYGAINMVAIEEYQNLQKRYDFLQQQKNDILETVDLLHTAINEIEEKSRKDYLDTFHSLNEEFSGLFPVLFPGGHAKLQILQEDISPLEAGVSILVKLPGKAQQNMRLFSGGERALTAIAFIFALLKSKPSPFCFLDEVDAALDETNVGRFNKVLENLRHRFQFIVITHRRRTMEVLDTLYGVTMQEPGVSKIVGVDMDKAIPDHLQKAFKDSNASARQGASAG